MGDRVPITVPELELAELTISAWLVRRGAQLTEGDRVVELLADGVTVDLSAPISGQLVRVLAREETPVVPGQIVAEIEPGER